MKQFRAVFLVMIVLFGAGVKADNTGAHDPATTFTFRINGDPESFDWGRTHSLLDQQILGNIMEGLVTHDESLKVVPALAESWTKSPDGKTYTFRLRPGVKWSDGVPLQAQDFVFSWKRLLSPVSACPDSYFLYDLVGGEDFYKGKIKDFSEVGVKAIDDLTLQVKLRAPVAYFLHVLTFLATFPMRKDLVEKNGTAWFKPGNLVTLGPFIVSEYDIESKLILKANHSYYGKRGNIETLVAQIVKDGSTALGLYELGKLDYMGQISTVDLQRLSGRPDLKFYPLLNVNYLGFSVDRFPVNNVHVRRAIMMAIDRSQMPRFLNGKQVTATSLIPPSLMAHEPGGGLPYDPAGAKIELQKAGLGGGKFPTLELLCSDWEKPLLIAQFIQAELKKNLGIEVQIQAFERDNFRRQADLHSYPLFTSNWSADFPDPDNFMSIFLGLSGNNNTGWKNAVYDQKVLEARTSQDPKAREKLYLAAQKILIQEETAVGPLFYEPSPVLVKPRAQKFPGINPLGDLFLKDVVLH